MGPVGVLCIRRSLANGRWAGLATGLGAATADACYGAVAAFGLTAISGFLLGHRHALLLVGGFFLCYLGVRTVFGRATFDVPVGAGRTRDRASLLGSYASTIVLTLTNPATILSFAAVFAGLGLVSAQASPANAVCMVGGVFLGSAAWWLILSAGVSRFRSRLNATLLATVNRICGSILIALGAYALLSFRR